MRNWSIKIRFSLGLSAVFVAALLIVLQIVLSELKDRFQHSIGNDLTQLVDSHASILDARIDSARQILRDIASAAPDQAFDQTIVAQAFVEQQQGVTELFDLGLYIANAEENLLAAHLTTPEAGRRRIGQKTAVPDTNALARQTGELQISRPYPSPSCGGCPAIVMVQPIFNQGVFRGFVAGALRLSGRNLLATLGDVRIGEGGYLYIVTSERLMIMHPDPRRLMKTATQPGQNLLLDKALSEHFEGFGTTINSTGTRMMVGFRYLKTTGWLLGANFPAEEAERPFEAARKKVYLIALPLGVLVLFLVWMMTQRLLAPLSVLTRHVTRLPEDRERRRITLGVGGEIGALENAFNQMMDDLDLQQSKQRGVESDIRHLNANLEKLVEERTAALASSNRELENVIHRLTITQQELVEAEKLAALGALVAGIAHELNTPIGNCVLVASKLGEQTSTLVSDLAIGQIRKSTLTQHLEQLDGAVDILRRNLDKASLLISSFKQTAVDRTSDLRRRFKLADLISDTTLSMHPMLHGHQCSVQATIPNDIEMDSFPGSLGQAIMALLENAMVHAYPDQGGIITITAARDEERVRIAVCDTGYGIDADNLSRIFDPFFTTRFGQGGSGLGLHIVYNIVTGLLGGKISVVSHLGEGSCFQLTLPVVAPA